MQHTEGGNYFAMLIKLSALITYAEEEIWELEIHFSVSNCYTLGFCFTWGILHPLPPAEGRNYGVCFFCGFGLILK